MASKVRGVIPLLERLSLITCTEDVLTKMELCLKNVEPILNVDTKDVEPMIWITNLPPSKMHEDIIRCKLSRNDLKMNAPRMVEDYFVVGKL